MVTAAMFCSAHPPGWRIKASMVSPLIAFSMVTPKSSPRKKKEKQERHNWWFTGIGLMLQPYCIWYTRKQVINQKNLKHNLCTMSKLQLMSLNYTNDRRHALSFKHLGSLKNVLVFERKTNGGLFDESKVWRTELLFQLKIISSSLVNDNISYSN